MAGSLAGTLSHFQNPTSKVSSHYGVGRKGEIHQYVKESDGAWTNGRVLKPSSTQILQRRGNPNQYTITIEFEGKDRGGTDDLGKPIRKSRIYKNVNAANATLDNVHAFGQAMASLSEWPLDQIILSNDQEIIEA